MGYSIYLLTLKGPSISPNANNFSLWLSTIDHWYFTMPFLTTKHTRVYTGCSHSRRGPPGQVFSWIKYWPLQGKWRTCIITDEFFDTNNSLPTVSVRSKFKYHLPHLQSPLLACLPWLCPLWHPSLCGAADWAENIHGSKVIHYQLTSCLRHNSTWTYGQCSLCCEDLQASSKGAEESTPWGKVMVSEFDTITAYMLALGRPSLV